MGKRQSKEAITPTNKPEDRFIHKKSLGQNFLTSEVVPNWMCEAGKVTAGDKILEIGPGTGMLTKVLLAKGAEVIAIEADERALEQLETTFKAEIASKQLTLHHGDAREITPLTLGLKDRKFKIVANIPYYLSGFLLRSFLDNKIQPISLTFLIQKELAHRIARDKKESILSLSVKVFGNPIYVKTVAKGHFIPKPKVDSAILSIQGINQDNFKDVNKEAFFDTLHLGLGNKRKQLLGNLSQKYERQSIIKIFQELNIKETARGEDLLLEVWLEITRALEKLE